MSTNTDVPAAILGFYYQLLLACKELVILLNCFDDASNYVAVEKGADIRILKQKDTLVEAKFYKNDNFTRNHSSIRHTLYNFYNSFIDHKISGLPYPLFIYRTNVKVHNSDKTFFQQWNDGIFNPQSDYLQYVKDCIVYEAVQRDPYNSAFEQYLNDVGIKAVGKKEPGFSVCIKALIDFLHVHPECYCQYGKMLEDTNVSEFLHLIKFNFADVSEEKANTLARTRGEITALLQTFDHELKEHDCEKIRNWIIEEFFDTDRVKAISIQDLINKIQNHTMINLRYLEETEMKEYLMVFDDLIETFHEHVINYGFDENKEQLISSFVIFLEEFAKEVSDTSLVETSAQYTLDRRVYEPYLIGDLFRAMSILCTFSGINVNDVKISSKVEGIRNFSLNSEHRYCLKGTQNTLIRDDFSSLIGRFIRQTIESRCYGQISGDEKIVFQSNCKPCEMQLDIEQMVSNVSQVYGNLELQALFASLDYKCTRCLVLHPSDTPRQVQCFRRGNCRDGYSE
jgi:hypothetical protein